MFMFLLNRKLSPKPRVKLKTPPSVILSHLRIKRNEASNSLLFEEKTDSVESCKMPEAL